MWRKLSSSYRSRWNSKFSIAPVNFINPAGIPGSGVGKGGGGGGSIREAGGGLGRLGSAMEDGYFHQQQKEQLKQIKQKLKQGQQIDSVEKRPK